MTDFGITKGGATFIVMERLYGRTLGDELDERGALPVAEALAWGRQVLDALDAAHRAGIVHRDVKPDNVFLCDATETTPRHAKLLDFGVAHMANAGVSVNQLTLEGQMVGTPRTAAPEQITGKKADARSDIYGVGVLLYTMLAGRGPFAEAKTSLDVLRAHLYVTPAPPSSHESQAIPPELDEAILMALAKSPDARFQTPGAFRNALDGIADGLTTAPPRTGRARRRVDAAPSRRGALARPNRDHEGLAARPRVDRGAARPRRAPALHVPGGHGCILPRRAGGALDRGPVDGARRVNVDANDQSQGPPAPPHEQRWEDGEGSFPSGLAFRAPGAAPYRGTAPLFAGKYRLLEQLGRGGMGVVYAAEHIHSGATVAIKMVPAKDEAMGDRMVRESRALARLGHPKIIQMFDSGVTDEGDYYIIMERVPGETLRTLMQRAIKKGRRLSLRLVLGVLAETAEAAESAHGAGIVHRDIKPENIMVMKLGHAKLIDFGLAKDSATVAPADTLGAASNRPTSPERRSTWPLSRSTAVTSMAAQTFMRLASCCTRPSVGAHRMATLRPRGRMSSWVIISLPHRSQFMISLRTALTTCARSSCGASKRTRRSDTSPPQSWRRLSGMRGIGVWSGPDRPRRWAASSA